MSEHLRGSIAWTSAGCAELLSILVEVAQSKINEFDIVVADQDVLRFNISMGNAQRMQIFYCSQYLLKI